MNALDIARAALMEVGGDPTSVWEIPDRFVPGRMTLMAMPWFGDNMTARLLGLMAAHGSGYLIRCIPCQWADAPEPCTPVREVIRGITCGRER